MRFFSHSVGILFAALTTSALAATTRVDEQDFPRPPMPAFVDGYMTMHEIVRVTVTFDDEGRVQSCDALNGSFQVRRMTCDSIMRDWRSTLFAHKTVLADINYGQPGLVHVTLQPPPFYPYKALAKHDGGRFVLDITFDGTGHVSSCQIASGSAPKELTDWTRSFVIKYWTTIAFMGQTVRVPFVFVPRS